jgi:inorganic pyrophosphatase
MKKSSIIVSGALLVLIPVFAVFANQAISQLNVPGLTLKPGNPANSICDTLAGERNLYRDYPSKNADGTINAAIEIPAGTNAKWETDTATGHLFLELKNGAPRVVQYIAYPGNYGMIPRTKGGDGDPLDVVVLGRMMRRGAVAPVKPIGVLFLNDNGSIDDKILAVQPGTFMGTLNSMVELDDQYPGMLDIIKTWFGNYKGVGGGLSVKGFGDIDTAMEIINAAIRDTSSTGYPVSYGESPDDSMIADGFTRTYGKYGVSLTGVLGDDDTITNGKQIYTGYPALNPAGGVNEWVEIPGGTSSKWETDVNTGKMYWENKGGQRRVTKFLGYPGDYGMIPRTKGGDGDPLDIIILGDFQLRGSFNAVKPIGVMFLIDQGLIDDKILAVAPGGAMSEINTVSELNAKYPGITSIIETWFTNYKGLNGGLASHGFGEYDTARIIIHKAITDFGDTVATKRANNAGQSVSRLNPVVGKNSRISVAFSLSNPERVKMDLYSLAGKEAASLIDEKFTSGGHRISLDARAIKPGCYIFKMQAGNRSQTTNINLFR